jgi:hypothetical protein
MYLTRVLSPPAVASIPNASFSARWTGSTWLVWCTMEETTCVSVLPRQAHGWSRKAAFR